MNEQVERAIAAIRNSMIENRGTGDWQVEFKAADESTGWSPWVVGCQFEDAIELLKYWREAMINPFNRPIIWRIVNIHTKEEVLDTVLCD